MISMHEVSLSLALHCSCKRYVQHSLIALKQRAHLEPEVRKVNVMEIGKLFVEQLCTHASVELQQQSTFFFFLMIAHHPPPQISEALSDCNTESPILEL